MEATQVVPSHIAASTTHPLLLIAAASVTVLSLAGVGVLAGWLPGPGAHASEAVKVASATTPIPATAPISIQQTVTVPKEQAKPAIKSAERSPARGHRSEPARMARSPSYSQSSREPSFGAEDSHRAVSPAPTYASSTYAASPPPVICSDCGIVEAVNAVAVEPKGSGGGAVGGGIIGGIIGNQFGKGATRDIATVLGAVGGAYAGNHIEKSVKESKRYDVVVRFEDGSTRTFSSDSPPAWHSGDRVKLQNGTLTMGGGNSNGPRGTI